MGSSLLVEQAGLARNRKRLGMAGQGLLDGPGGLGGFPQTEQRRRLTVPVTDLAEDSQRLKVMCRRLMEQAGAGTDHA